MLATLAPLIAGLIGKAIDKAVPDKDMAEKLKANVILEAMKKDNAELQGAIQIITAEAQGESWLQRNWRPMTMLFLMFLIGAYWLGFTPINLSEESINALFELVKVGLGGYVIGRSVEKTMKAYKEK